MHRPLQKARLALAIFLTSLVLPLFTPQSSHATDTTQRLRTSITRMNHWLGSGEKARSWRRVLDLNLLDSLAAQGQQAHPDKLRSILTRFEQEQESLAHPIFNDVRESIRAQIEQLERSQSVDLNGFSFAMSGSFESYQSPKQSLEKQRQRTLSELYVFRQFYRRDYSAEERAKVFGKLKLEETIELLSTPGMVQVLQQSEGSETVSESEVEDAISVLESPIAELSLTNPLDLEESDGACHAPLPFPAPLKEGRERIFRLTPMDTVCCGISELPSDTVEEQERARILSGLCAARERFRNQLNPINAKSVSELATKIGQSKLSILKPKSKMKEPLKKVQDLLENVGTDPALTAAFNAIDRFTEAYRFATDKDVQKTLPAMISKLRSLVPDLDNPDKRRSHAEVGAIVHWLEARRQAPDLCVAIRTRYSKPNLYISVSRDALDKIEIPPFPPQYTKIAEQLLGRFARGLAYTTANISVAPVENPDQAQLAILVNGNTSTNVYVRQLGIKVHTAGSGTISARKDLFATLGGLQAGSLSTSARICNQFAGLSTPRGRLEQIQLVQNFAQKEFAKQAPEANREAERTAQNVLKTEFEKQATELLGVAFDVVDSIAAMVRRVSLQMPDTYLRTSSERIEAVLKYESFQGFGATSPPAFRNEPKLFELVLHESAINNFFDDHFSGREFSIGDFQRIVSRVPTKKDDSEPLPGDGSILVADDAEDLPGDEAEPLPGDGDSEFLDWTIWLQKVRPIQVELDDDRIRVRIRGNRLVERKTSSEISKQFEIRISYKIVSWNGNLFRQNDGTPKIHFFDGITPPESAELVDTIEKRFVKLDNLPLDSEVKNIITIIESIRADEREEAGSSEQELAEENPVNKLFAALKTVQLGRLEFRDGWLYLGVNDGNGYESIYTPAIWPASEEPAAKQ